MNNQLPAGRALDTVIAAALTIPAAEWRAIYTAYAGGTESYTSIAQALNARGLRLQHWRDGTRLFGRESIRSILSNPAYRGMVRCNGGEHQGRHPALITADVWEQCQRIRTDRASTSNTPGLRGSGGLLTELGYCSECGARLWYHRSGHHKHYYYRCGKRREYGPDGCPSRMIAAPIADSWVLDVVRVLRLPSALQAQVIARTQELLQPRPTQDQAIDPAKVKRKLERLRTAYLDGDAELTDVVYFAEKRRLEAMLETPLLPHPRVLDMARAGELLNDMARLIDVMNDEERRRAIRALFVRVWLSHSAGIAQLPALWPQPGRRRLALA